MGACRVSPRPQRAITRRKTLGGTASSSEAYSPHHGPFVYRWMDGRRGRVASIPQVYVPLRQLCPRRTTWHAVRMIAVYAGRFDPVTNGHLDIVRRASRIFDQVTIAVYDAPADKTLFPTSQRVSMLKTSVQEMPSVEVESFDGLLTDFVRNRGADAIVRGLRAVTDFSVEFDQALMYKDMAPEIEQVYLMSDLRFVFVRATRIREVARLGHDVSHLVPEPVAAALQEIWPLKS